MRIKPSDRKEAAVAGAAVHSKRAIMVSFSFFLFLSISLLTQPSPSLADNPNFDTDIDLFGDAQAVSGSVNLTRHSTSTSGLLLRRDPISCSTSFSAEFSFSISPDAGDGFVLVIVPAPDHLSAAFPGNGTFGLSQNQNNNYIAVEFDTSKDDGVDDPNGNHVGIDVGSLISVAIANVSDSDLVLNNGEKLNAWVDYLAGSKNLEVRLCKLGEKRPSNPIVSHSIDLAKFWSGEVVFIGLGSSNGVDSVQVVSVFSWKVRLGSKQHSEPADPNHEGHVAADQRKGGYGTLSILATVIFVTGSVTLVSFVVLFMWAIFFQRRESETLGNMTERPMDQVRYARIDVAVDNNNVLSLDHN